MNDIESAPAADYDVLIVGAGFAGLRMLHEARQRGFTAHVLESGSGVGGTWFWNRYPGARCDVVSADYSYAFSPELDQEWRWSERYATQPEILRYIDHVVAKFDLLRDITLETTVVAATWLEQHKLWAIEDDTGRTRHATTLVMATGCLSVPKMPNFSGEKSFRGESYHTAYWPHHDVDFSGKRVAVIGTGSSGTQLIPIAARSAGHLTVFQRTPNFSIPARNRPVPDDEDRAIKAEYPDRRVRALNSPTGLGFVPTKVKALEAPEQERNAHYEAQWNSAGFGFILSYPDLLLDDAANETAASFIRAKIAETVKDPQLAEKLSPTGYPFGAKRACVDSGYFETFNRENVTLVDMRDTPIAEITPTGIRTSDALYEVDMIVYATGFDAMTGALLRFPIRGVGGHTLAERWAEGPKTFLGIMTDGFPNFFFLTGPGSPSVLSNVLMSIEQHVDWLGNLLTHARDRGAATIEAGRDAVERWVEHVNELAAGTLYPKARSYYMGDEIAGKPRVFMPYSGGLRGFRRRCDEVAANGYPELVFREHATQPVG